MAFRYTLQSLLRLRQSLEHQEEQRLYAAAAVVAQLRAKLEQMERERVSAGRAALQEIADGTFGATLQFVAACDAAAALNCAKLEIQLAEAERRRLEQLRVYQTARQKREIFEGLRDQQKSVYDQERAHREQELADEAFLLRGHTTPSE
jgi:flagellar export protein FliJ